MELTGDIDATGDQILKRVQDRFNIDIKDVHFIFLRKRSYLEAERYPSFTLLGQSLGLWLKQYNLPQYKL